MDKQIRQMIDCRRDRDKRAEERGRERESERKRGREREIEGVSQIMYGAPLLNEMPFWLFYVVCDQMS